MSYRNRTSTDMSLRSQADTSIKYHGLRSQGATCYLNSVLQVMYMTKDFREAVKSHCHETPRNTYIDVQLNTLFDGLKTCVEQTRAITRKLGIKHVHQQQDAADYYEKILRMTSPEASQIFHGELTHRTTCSGCQKSSDANAFFWSIHLAMPDPSKVYDVKDGFDMFFRPVSVNGDNQMYCDMCGSKEDATIACELKEQPEVLVLLLKRFDFDYQSMTHVKVNSSVDIPDTLHTPQKQTYELYAIVDHYGDLRGGHYSSRIKSLEDGDDHGRWYRFDDARVTEVNRQQLQEEIQRSWSAYLLYYRKQQMPSPGTSAPETNRLAEDHQRPISDHLKKRKSQGADVDDVGDAKQIKTTLNVEHEVKPETPNKVQGTEEGDLFKTGPVEKHQHTGRFQSLGSKSGEAKQDIEERAHMLTGHGEFREDTDRGGGVDGDGIVREATERSHVFIPEEGEKRIVKGDVQRTSGESRVGREQSGPSTPSKVPLAKTEGSRAEREKDGREEMQKYNVKVEDESQQTEPPSGHDENHVTDMCSAKADAERRVRQNRFPLQHVVRWEEPNTSQITVDEAMETSVDDCTGLRNQQAQREQAPSQQNIYKRTEICDVKVKKYGPGTPGQGFTNSGYNIGKNHYPEVNNLETLGSKAQTAKQARNNEKQRKTHGDKEKIFVDSTMVVEQSAPETPSKVVLLAKTDGSRSETEIDGRGETPKDKFEVEDESQQTDQCEPPSGYSEKHVTEDCGDKADAERRVRQNLLSVQQVDRREDSNTSQFTADVAKVTDPCEAVDDCTGLGQGSKNSGSKKGKNHYPEVNYLETLDSNAHTAKQDSKKSKKMMKDKKKKQRKTQGDKEKTFGDSTMQGEQCRTERSLSRGSVMSKKKTCSCFPFRNPFKKRSRKQILNL